MKRLTIVVFALFFFVGCYESAQLNQEATECSAQSQEGDLCWSAGAGVCNPKGVCVPCEAAEHPNCEDLPGSQDTGIDTGTNDTAMADVGSGDTGSQDTGSWDTGSQDSGSTDTNTDTGDNSSDTGTADTGGRHGHRPESDTSDTGVDTEEPDTGSSQDSGTHPDTDSSVCADGEACMTDNDAPGICNPSGVCILCDTPGYRSTFDACPGCTDDAHCAGDYVCDMNIENPQDPSVGVCVYDASGNQQPDAGMPDADAGSQDTGSQDTGSNDTGGQDTGSQDAGTDTSTDTGSDTSNTSDTGTHTDSDTGTSQDTGCQVETWYHDSDGDGFGNPYDTMTACTQPVDYAAQALCDNNADGTQESSEMLCTIDADNNGTDERLCFSDALFEGGLVHQTTDACIVGYRMGYTFDYLNGYNQSDCATVSPVDRYFCIDFSTKSYGTTDLTLMSHEGSQDDWWRNDRICDAYQLDGSAEESFAEDWCTGSVGNFLIAVDWGAGGVSGNGDISIP